MLEHKPKKLSPIGHWLATAVVVSALFGIASFSHAAENDDPIRFALTSPLSPPGDVQSGEAIQKAAEVWVDHVNDEGGILGRPVRIKAFDTEGKPAIGTQVARRAIVDYGASAIVGAWASSVVLAEMRIAHRYDVPLLVFYSWADKITGMNYPEVFRIGPYNSQIAGSMLDFIKHQDYERVALLAENTAYGAGFAEKFQNAAKGSGIELKVVVYPARANDLTAELSKIKQFNPDALIIEAVYPAKNLAIKQAQEVGLDAQIIAGWDWPTLPGFWPAVGKAGEGIIYASFKGSDESLTSVGKQFRAAYRDRYGEDPAIFQYFFIDTLNAVRAAIKKSGTGKPAKLVQTLPTVSFKGTTGHIEFAHNKGTVHFNQWDDVGMYFNKLAEVGQKANNAKLIYTTH